MPADIKPNSGGSPNEPRIGELLVKEGLITQDHLANALAIQKLKGGKTVEILIAQESIAMGTFVDFLANRPGVASINLLNYEIPKKVIDLVPAAFALKHELLPIDQLGKDLTIGMACPLDSRTIKELSEITGLRVRPLLVSMNDIRVALDRYYVPKEPATFEMRRRDDATAPARRKADAEEEAQAPEEPPAPPEVLDKAESGIRFEGVVHLVREIHSLPALPETVSQVRGTMEDPESTAADVAQIIARDPSMAAKVISIANSAAYGFTHTVDSVDMATRLLGLREIYSVVLSSAVIDYFAEDKNFDYKAFWRRSMFAGTAARVIAQQCGRKTSSGVFAAGLLHDLGRLVFAEIAPERYKEVDQSLRDVAVIEAEDACFGIAHPEAGYMLADGWGLPVEITEPIRFHNDFTKAEEAPQLTAIVALAALMTDIFGRINKDNAREYAAECQPLLRALDLEESKFIQILGETSKSFHSATDE